MNCAKSEKILSGGLLVYVNFTFLVDYPEAILAQRGSRKKVEAREQCDQIWRFIGLWASF